jgi:hypothetical protein
LSLSTSTFYISELRQTITSYAVASTTSVIWTRMRKQDNISIIDFQLLDSQKKVLQKQDLESHKEALETFIATYAPHASNSHVTITSTFVEYPRLGPSTYLLGYVAIFVSMISGLGALVYDIKNKTLRSNHEKASLMSFTVFWMVSFMLMVLLSNIPNNLLCSARLFLLLMSMVMILRYNGLRIMNQQ